MNIQASFHHKQYVYNGYNRALAHAVGGWLQQLELGLRLWNRELKLLADALCKDWTYSCTSLTPLQSEFYK
jgi:hypothetical protein